MKKSTLLILLSLNVLWAGTYAATKLLMAQGHFFAITSLRYLIGIVPLVLLTHFRHGLRAGARDVLRCAVIGISTFTLAPLLIYAGVAIGRSADAAIITSTEPLLVSLGAYLYLRERLDRRTLAALLIAFAGAVLLSEFWTATDAARPASIMLIACGVFFEAFYSVLGKELLTRLPPLKVITLALLSGSAVNVLILSLTGRWPDFTHFQVVHWAILGGYLSLICTVVGYTFWFYALRETAVATVAITIFVQIPFGLAFSRLWVGEQPTGSQILGAAIILAAVSLAVVRPRGAGREPPEFPPNQ